MPKDNEFGRNSGGLSWLDGLADDVHAAFPNAVVNIGGQHLGTKADVDASVEAAFQPVDEKGRLPNDPRLAVIRQQRSISVRKVLME